MKRTLFPGYSVGTDAYEDIKEICPAYGKKAAIIGGKHALAAAQDKIIAAAKEAGIEIIGPFWYGGEASVENIEMLKPKAADADMISLSAAARLSTPARYSPTRRTDRSSHSRPLLRPAHPARASAYSIIRTEACANIHSRRSRPSTFL